MKRDQLRSAEPANSRVVVALFGQTRQVSDAVADLKHAGFDKYQIRVGFAAEEHQHSKGNGHAKAIGATEDPRKQHTLSWRLRRSFELDLHRRGETQLSRNRKSKAPSVGLHELYSAVNLHDALQSLCAREDRIRLLKNEIGPRGAIVLVDAEGRWKEAESILARVAGKIRTDTATELPPFNA